jgi:hypothetical protein
LLIQKKKLVFFCFVGEFGGARRSGLFLIEKLRKYYDIQVIDIYGSCEPYINALMQIKVPTHILAPDVKPIVIGHYDNMLKRIAELIKHILALLKIRHRFVKKVLEIDPDALWTSCPKSLAFLATSLCLRKYPVIMFARAWYKQCQVSVWKRWALKYRTNRIMAISKLGSKRE